MLYKLGNVLYDKIKFLSNVVESGDWMSIYVWGTGCGAGELMDTALSPEKVAAFVDERPQTERFLGRPVIPPSALRDSECELILVTVRNTDEVARRCAEQGIGEEKLFFLKNRMCLQDRNRSCRAAEAILGPEFLARMQGTERLIRRPLWTEKETLDEQALSGDYVRLKTLEMLCRQIEDIPGAAAELGVYRGSFARCLNALLPGRRLYLFDTFAGFDSREAEGEAEGFVQAHRNTGTDAVLTSMPHPERIVLRKGLFPATAAGLEQERFALVSLDVDLEGSTLAGLRFFLPRLASGGYLLLHDYYSPKLPGVKRALRRYEEERETPLHKFPVCDVNGTLVISA